MESLQFFSILLESLVALLGLKIAFRQKKSYGWLIFLTFGIYVFYDLAKMNRFSLIFSQDFLTLLFFIATVSAFLAVWQIAKRK